MDKVPNVICSIIIGYVCESYREWSSIKSISKYFQSCCNHRLAYEHIILKIPYMTEYKSYIERIPYTKSVICYSINDKTYEMLSKMMRINCLSFYKQLHANTIGNPNLFPYWKQLQELSISGNHYINDNVLKIILRKCDKLEKLSLSNCIYIRGTEFDSLLPLSNLKLLHLSSLPLEPISFAFISESISIKSLEIYLYKLYISMCIRMSSMFLSSLSLLIHNHYADLLMSALIGNNLQSTLVELRIKVEINDDNEDDNNDDDDDDNDNADKIGLTEVGIYYIGSFINLKVLTLENCKSLDDKYMIKLIKVLPFLSLVIK